MMLAIPIPKMMLVNMTGRVKASFQEDPLEPEELDVVREEGAGEGARDGDGEGVGAGEGAGVGEGAGLLRDEEREEREEEREEVVRLPVGAGVGSSM